MKTGKFQIKAIKKITKNNKEVIVPILVNVEDDTDAYFINDGFSVTLTLNTEEIEKLVENGKLYSSKLARKQKAESKTSEVVKETID